MAEQAKLNNIARAKTQHQLDMEALQRGAMSGAGSLYEAQAPTLKTMKPEIPAQAGETDEEAAVPAMQAANANNPGVQDKLNMMAKARAKFYGEGI